MVTNRKTPILWGKGAVICATGGERVGYLLHFLKAPRIRVERNSATLKPEERPVVRSTNAAFAHDLCMEHFSSALSGVSTNCALSGTQRHTPLDSGDESAEQITPYRYLLLERPSCNRNYTRDNREQQNFPECVLPPSEFAHLPNLTKREICAGNNSQSVNVADGLSKVRNGHIFLSPFGYRQDFSVMVGHALGCPPTLCQRAVTLGHEDMGPGDRRGLSSALQDSPRGRGAGFVRVHHSTVNLDLLQNRAGFKTPDDLVNDRRLCAPSIRVVHEGRLGSTRHRGVAGQEILGYVDSHWNAPNQEGPLAFLVVLRQSLYSFHSGITRLVSSDLVEGLPRDTRLLADGFQYLQRRLRQSFLRGLKVHSPHYIPDCGNAVKHFEPLTGSIFV
jgi:hypothetical protein